MLYVCKMFVLGNGTFRRRLFKVVVRYVKNQTTKELCIGKLKVDFSFGVYSEQEDLGRELFPVRISEYLCITRH